MWTCYLDTYRKEEDSLDAWEIGKVRWANETYMSMGYTSMAQVRKAAELAEFAQERWDRDTMSVCSQVRDGEEQVPAELFAGIGADHLRISYGGLHEMLRRLDMAVEGTLEHCWFTGADGPER